jgi:hypothetical protein
VDRRVHVGAIVSIGIAFSVVVTAITGGVMPQTLRAHALGISGTSPLPRPAGQSVGNQRLPHRFAAHHWNAPTQSWAPPFADWPHRQCVEQWPCIGRSPRVGKCNV